MTMEWLPAHLRGLAWALLGAVVAGVLVTLLSMGRARLSDGWVVLRPSPLGYGVGVLSIPMAAFLLSFGIVGFFGRIPEWGSHPRLVAAGMTLVGLMFPYCAVTTFCVRVRFNGSGLEKSWFGRPTFIPWSEVRKLDRGFFAGPRVVTTSGRSVRMSEDLLGFPDLVRMAEHSGVAVSDEFRK